MRIVVCVVTALFALYVGSNAIAIAGIGVTNQIPQLEAAGSAECLIALGCLISAGLIFWRWWLPVCLLACTLIWSMLVAIYYLDVTVWFWVAAIAILTAGASLVGWRRARKTKQKNIRRQQATQSA